MDIFQILESVWVQSHFEIFKINLTSTLDRKGWVHQIDWVDEVLWFCLDIHFHEHWSVIASPIVRKTSVLFDFCRTISIVFEKNPITVGGTLVIFVFIDIFCLFQLVAGHEIDFPLLIGWEITTSFGYF